MAALASSRTTCAASKALRGRGKTRAARVQQLTASCGSLPDSNSFAVPAPPSCAAHLPLHKQPLGCKKGGCSAIPTVSEPGLRDSRSTNSRSADTVVVRFSASEASFGRSWPTQPSISSFLLYQRKPTPVTFPIPNRVLPDRVIHSAGPHRMANLRPVEAPS